MRLNSVVKRIMCLCITIAMICAALGTQTHDEMERRRIEEEREQRRLDMEHVQNNANKKTVLTIVIYDDITNEDSAQHLNWEYFKYSLFLPTENIEIIQSAIEKEIKTLEITHFFTLYNDKMIGKLSSAYQGCLTSISRLYNIERDRLVQTSAPPELPQYNNNRFPIYLGEKGELIVNSSQPNEKGIVLLSTIIRDHNGVNGVKDKEYIFVQIQSFDKNDEKKNLVRPWGRNSESEVLRVVFENVKQQSIERLEIKYTNKDVNKDFLQKVESIFKDINKENKDAWVLTYGTKEKLPTSQYMGTSQEYEQIVWHNTSPPPVTLQKNEK